MRNKKSKKIYGIDDIYQNDIEDSQLNQIEMEVRKYRFRRIFHLGSLRQITSIDINELNDDLAYFFYDKLKIDFKKIQDKHFSNYEKSNKEIATIRKLENRIKELEDRLDNIETKNDYFDPYEFFGLNDKSIEELEQIANQETIKINLDDLQRVLEGENE